MKVENLESNVVKKGTFLYDGTVECDLRIVYSKIRYGSGDYEDPPELENDLIQDTFYLEYGSTTQRGVYNAGGGGFQSIEEAMKQAESTVGFGHTVKWHES